MNVALFLTTSAERAAELLASERRQHPDARFVAFVRDDDRDALAQALAGCEVRRDKPAGGRLAWLRALRRERFDVAVVAWHGERFQPLLLAALLCGAHRTFAVDDRGRRRAVRWFAPWTWGKHALRRLSQVRAMQLLGALAALYRGTVGVLVAAACLVPSAFRAARLAAGTPAAPRRRRP